MTTVVKARLIKIGNSRGIRIPKLLLDQTGIGQDVELEVQGDVIVVRAAQHPRADWDTAFVAMGATGDDRLLDDEAPGSWDEEEWAWPSDASMSI